MNGLALFLLNMTKLRKRRHALPSNQRTQSLHRWQLCPRGRRSSPRAPPWWILQQRGLNGPSPASIPCSGARPAAYFGVVFLGSFTRRPCTIEQFTRRSFKVWKGGNPANDQSIDQLTDWSSNKQTATLKTKYTKHQKHCNITLLVLLIIGTYYLPTYLIFYGDSTTTWLMGACTDTPLALRGSRLSLTMLMVGDAGAIEGKCERVISINFLQYPLSLEWILLGIFFFL